MFEKDLAILSKDTITIEESNDISLSGVNCLKIPFNLSIPLLGSFCGEMAKGTIAINYAYSLWISFNKGQLQ